MNRIIPSSELIINEDGTIFHLHLRPNQIASKVILMGDPNRVDTVASFFDSREVETINREFHSITGTYQGKRVTALSTGIGCDNIDIVMTELDALVNIDFSTRQIKEKLTSLEIVRVGTCGGLQENTPVGTYIASAKSIGLDGLLNFYAKKDEVCDEELEKQFIAHMNWEKPLCIPYAVSANQTLLERISGNDMIKGITVCCGGFYGPQGRELRLSLTDSNQNTKIQSFEYNGLHVTNYEMESSAVAGMAQMLGHKAMTCCLVIAGRRSGEANTTYKNSIKSLVELVLKRI